MHAPNPPTCGRKPSRSKRRRNDIHDLLPHLDKPGIRRAVGSTAAAGGLLTTPVQADSHYPMPTFVLHGIDSPSLVPLPEAGNPGRPYLADVDDDGDLDLVSGSPTSVIWNENIGTPTSPIFVPAKSRHGLTAPVSTEMVWADFDGDGDDDQAFLKQLIYYENVGSDEKPELIQRSKAGNPLADLGFQAVAAADLNGDGLVDLIDSNFGLHDNFQNVFRITNFSKNASHPFDRSGFVKANPQAISFGDLDGDGDFDAFVYQKANDSFNQINDYFENVGDRHTPHFKARHRGLPRPFSWGFFGGIPGFKASQIAFADADRDGDLDAHLGDLAMRNVGTKFTPSFVTDANLSIHAFPNPSDEALVDYDGDGDHDHLKVFRDTIGIAHQDVDFQVLLDDKHNPFGGYRLFASSFSFVDIDGDTDLDLFVASKRDSRIYYFKNLSIQPADEDRDGDGLPDIWEIRHFGDPLNSDPLGDPDGDSLSNLRELIAGTDPGKKDTDDDGITDDVELESQTLPLTVYGDEAIRKGLPNFRRIQLSADPVEANRLRLQADLPPRQFVEIWHSHNLIRWDRIAVTRSADNGITEMDLARLPGEGAGYYRLTPFR